jgi:YVTN family beta-propeller protein
MIHSAKNTIFIIIIFAALAMPLTTMLATRRAAADNQAGFLLVDNKDDHTLGIVDPQLGKQVGVIPVGGITGHEVASSPDGKTAWVPIYGNSGVGLPGTDGSTISVIDLNLRKVTSTIDLGAPSRPHCAVFCAVNNRLYVTAEVTNSVKIIDPATNAVVGSIPTDRPQSHMLAVSSDGTRGYTANVNTGTVSVLDLRKNAVIPVAKTVQRIGISPDNRWVFTSDQTKPELDVIDTQSNKVSSRITLQGKGYGVAPTQDGKKLLIALIYNDSVAVLNLQTMKIDQVIGVPKGPGEIVIPPGDRVAYVSCELAKQIAVIDIASAKVEKLIDVGAGADGLAWAPASSPAKSSK